MLASAMVEDSSFEDDQLTSMSTDDIVRAPELLDNENRILKEELQRSNLELDFFKDKIKGAPRLVLLLQKRFPRDTSY